MRATTPMRLLPMMVMTTMVACTPESHVLLSSEGDGGSDATGAGDVWTSCMASRAEGAMGDACAFDDACGGIAGEAGAARCLRGELLIYQATSGGPGGGTCDDAHIIDTGYSEPFVLTARPEPGCFSASVCADGVAGRAFTLCQRSPRLSVRDDASPAFSSCSLAANTGRDGDPCVGGFSCYSSDVAGHGQIAWCDDGILRLAPPYGLSEV